MQGLSGAVGVMTLYRAESDAFSRDHLRILLAISPKRIKTIWGQGYLFVPDAW